MNFRHKYIFFISMTLLVIWQPILYSHCQMPCGIYHDDLVFDLIDQYIETMVKGVTILKTSEFKTPKERNEFVRWVMEKEKESNDAAHLITEFFLQQKIKPGESDTTEKVLSAHKLLFLIVAIKQTADLQALKDFYKEWNKFKLMFHFEGYECEMEKKNLKELEELREYMNQKGQKKNGENKDSSHNHSHDHSHDHEH